MIYPGDPAYDAAPLKVQVAACGEDVWSENAVRFASHEEAKAYARDLLGRWMGADMARVVSVETPRGEGVDPADERIVASYRRAT